MSDKKIGNKTISNMRKQYLISSGLDVDDAAGWANKYGGLKSHNKQRVGVDCLLTFNEYIDLAVSAGLTSPDQIGTDENKYCVGRIGDIGNYELGNCRFITNRQNWDEMKTNGVGERIADRLRGRKNPEHSARMSGRTKEMRDYLADRSKMMTGQNKENNAGVASMAIKKSKRFRLVSPDGHVFEGINLNEFCKQNSLLQAPMSALCRGVYPNGRYKGWTGDYLEVVDE